ncbi:MAG: hypothetical protein ACKVS6_12145 [Planctomycetota bacterium]
MITITRPFIYLIFFYAFFAAAIFSPAARAQEFAGGRVFVGSSDGKIRELDINGAVQNTFGPFDHCQTPSALAFGPNGHLYIAFSDAARIIEINGAGTVVKTYTGGGQLAAPSNLIFGANGRIFVYCYSPSKLVEITKDDAVVASTAMGDANETFRGGCFAPNGRLYGIWNTSKLIKDIDPSGKVISPVAAPAQFAGFEATQILRAHDGALWVMYKNVANPTIAQFNETGTLLSSIEAPSGTSQFAFGPDGHIYCSAADQIHVYNRSGSLLRTLGPVAGAANILSLTFSPYRFSAKCSGVVYRPSEPARAVNEMITISLTPNSGTAFVTFADQPALDSDLASMFQTTEAPFHGFDVSKNQTEKARTFQGTHVMTDASSNGAASLSLFVNGKIGAAVQDFQPKIARGVLHFTRGTTTFDALITTLKLLKQP